jgi:hypothetical protein
MRRNGNVSEIINDIQCIPTFLSYNFSIIGYEKFSGQSISAVNGNIRASHIARGIGRAEEVDLNSNFRRCQLQPFIGPRSALKVRGKKPYPLHFKGRRKSATWDQFKPLLAHFFGCISHDISLDKPGRNTVDTAEVNPFHSKRFCELDNSCLGCVILYGFELASQPITVVVILASRVRGSRKGILTAACL